MNKKILIGVVGVAALATIAVTTAFAYQGDSSKKGPNHTDAREAAITQAVTTLNYEAWKSLMTPGCKMVTVVTKEKFPRFAEMWKLQHAGNMVEASKIRTELGLGQGMKHDGGNKGCTGSGQCQHKNVSR